MPRPISRRLHPLHAGSDACRPQGRVAAERASKQNNRWSRQSSLSTKGAFSNIKARGAAWYENELSAKGAVSNIKMARGAVKYQNVCLG